MSRRRSLRWVRAALVAALVAAPRVSRADDADSDAHILRGVELRRAGKNGEALAEFQAAYSLVPTPRARVQIALALQALGDWLGAERGLEEGLERADDPWIAQYRAALGGALATVRAHIGRLLVEVNVTQGELLLNGVVVHALPLRDPVRVLAGDLDVEARAPGYAPVRGTVHVEAGAELRETITLEPLAPSVVAHAAAPTPVAPSHALGSPPSVRARSVAAYISLGGAGAFVVGGLVAWRVRENDVATYNDNAVCLVKPVTRGQQCGSYADAAQVALDVEIGAYAAAAVAAGIGAWLVWAPTKRPSPATASCGPLGLLGIACEGRF